MVRRTTSTALFALLLATAGLGSGSAQAQAADAVDATLTLAADQFVITPLLDDEVRLEVGGRAPDSRHPSHTVEGW